MVDPTYFDQARQGKNDWWRYLITILFGFGLQLAVSFVLVIIVLLVYKTADLAKLPQTMVLFLTMGPFALMLAGLWAGLHWLNHRPFGTLIGPARRFRWNRLLFSGILWVLLAGLTDLLMAFLKPGLTTWTFDAQKYFPFFILALILTPIQTATEELIFRGYLMQGIGVATNRVWVPLAVQAILFGLLHGTNPEIGIYGFWVMMVYYIGFGAFLGWITLKSKSLDLALGVHLGNNLYSALIVTYPDSAIQSPALFTSHTFDPVLGILFLFITAGIYMLVLFWPGWRKAGVIATLLLALVLTVGCTFSGGQSAKNDQKQPALSLTDCVLHISEIDAQYRARCGTLPVFEDPNAKAGRKIDLHIAVIPAESTNPDPDPVFLLAGGPGQAATQAFLPLMPALHPVNFKHDLVMVDQRGSGASNPLDCNPGSDAEVQILGDELPLEKQISETETCLKNLNADTRYYTTPLAVKDLEDVREALGYNQVNLLGVSYGTRVALAYLHEYPQNVRSVVLNGVVPPGWGIGSTIEADAQQSIERIFSRCEAQPACSTAFPDLRANFTELMGKLEKEPVDLAIPDPLTSEKVSVHLTENLAASTLRFMTYSEDYSTLIPLLIQQAAVDGNYQPLVAQYKILVGPSAQEISYGLYLSVVCSEDLPLADTAEPRPSFFHYDRKALSDICAHWPHAQAPQWLSEPVRSDVPVLLLTGGADPVTPPRNAEIVRKALTNAQSIVVPEMGHTLIYQGCLPRVIDSFVSSASLKDLNTECLKTVQPLPFLTSFKGLQP